MSGASGVAGDAESRADAVAVLWALASKVEAGDLSEDGVRAAMTEARAAGPAVTAIRPWIAALAERTASKRESADRWRSSHDRVRGLSAVLANGAAALADEQKLTRALGGHGAVRELEAFYVTSGVHGHGWLGEVPLSAALRDRAVRLLLGRVVSEAELDPTALTRVEAMMRAQGLKEYARAVQ